MDAARVAREIAAALEQREIDYAVGGALALGYWGEPRGTIDVDVTVYVSSKEPSSVVNLLVELGCRLDADDAIASLRDHGFCRVRHSDVQVDVFIPTIPFYEAARARRCRVQLADQSIMIWDAETLAVFKMMFFRRRDLADVEQVLRVRGSEFDRHWVENQLRDIYSDRDPRLSRWRELAGEA